MRLNSSKKWEKLLKDKSFLNDFNYSVRRRCGYAISEIDKHNISKLLNIGSGQGYLEELFFSRKRKNISWTSLDITEYGLNRLKKYPINTVIGFAHDLPFDQNYFDCCVCMEVLEHIPKDMVGKVYTEIKRVLNNNGNLIISVPVFEPVSLINHPVGHVRKYTPREIVSELLSNGFTIEKSRIIFPFDKNIYFKDLISKTFSLRRPSIIFISCRKK